MALPKLSTPLFETTLPISGLELKFRPFLVKEEKVLLMGKEGDYNQQMLALRQLLGSIVVEPEKFDVDSLVMCDVEYLFAQVRSKSVNNIVELKYRDKEDKQIYTFEIDLDEIQAKIDPEHEYEFAIGDDLWIKMKDPTLGLISKLKIAKGDEANTASAFQMIASCIEKVWDPEEVYDTFTQKEAIDFVKSMELNMFEKLQKFYDSMPVIYHKITYTNKNGTERNIELKGLQDFF